MNVVFVCLLALLAHSTEALKCYTCFGESCRKSRGIPMECNNEVVEDFVKQLPIPIPPGVIGNIHFKDFECLKVDGVLKGNRTRAKTCVPVLPQPGLCMLLKLVLGDLVSKCGICQGDKCSDYKVM
ncbi:hypothetical protein ACFFRR_000128 [Megaselia abdita]